MFLMFLTLNVSVTFKSRQIRNYIRVSCQLSGNKEDYKVCRSFFNKADNIRQMANQTVITVFYLLLCELYFPELLLIL